MKKSYKKLLLFQLMIFLIFILNSFVSNILSGYNFVIFLVVCLAIFKFFFGFEKDQYRHTKDIIYEIIIFLTVFFVLFYLLGVFITFARTNNYYSWYGITTFILPLVLTIILKEVLRYMMLRKCENSKVLICIVFVLFSFLDITEAIYYNGFNSNYNIFIFIALSLLPTISTNLVLNYLSLKVGFRPVIFYLLVVNLYQYLIPIIPNPNEYMTAIIQFILPILLWIRLRKFFYLEEDPYTDRDYKKSNPLVLIIPILLTVLVVYFTSGYFHYYALAIASGSMEPKISKGDVVIVKKIDGDYSKLKIGQILVYKYEKVVIVHRIVKIIHNDDKYYFYTKGDANGNVDNYAIPEESIIGTTDFKIPYLGLPTVWLNEK